MKETIETIIYSFEASVTSYVIHYEVSRRGIGYLPYSSHSVGVLEGSRIGDKDEHMGVREFMNKLRNGYAVTLVLRSILT